MYINQIKKQIFELNEIPKLNKDLDKWFDLEDEINFLLNTTEDYIPIYFSYKHFFLNSFIVPVNKLRKGYIEDLLKWNSLLISYSYSYGYSYSKEKPKKETFKAMSDGIGTKTLINSTAFIFHRFNGDFKEKPFIELNQKIEHLLDIYWLGDKKAYCKLDDNGDFEKIFTVDKDKENEFTLCTIKQEDLNFYLFLTNSVLARVFDLDKIHGSWNSDVNYKRIADSYRDAKKEIFFNRTKVLEENGKPIRAWIKGFQIIRNEEKLSKMRKILEGREDREYTSFIIHDFKNKKIVEWSSNPKELGSYFVKNDLPFETSPAFFRSEVLSKYKQDPSKYIIEDRNITCRGSWSLEYDINEEGQVHAYICDLSRLPYQEQLYLSSFNEEPKAGISERAFKTDFMVSWDFDYDPLFSLKQILEKFPVAKVKNRKFHIWKMPDLPETRDIKTLNYVVTDSIKEWENQILILDQIIIEGLCTQSINQLAKYLGCRNEELGSLKQLIKCFETLSIEKSEITIFSDPLLKLWKLRSSVVAHAGKNYPKGDLKKHNRVLIEDCDKAMRKFADFIDRGLLNIDKL
jgi:hypothetical protein